MRVTLTIETGPHRGQVFTLAGHDMFLVGRSRNAHFRFDRKDMYFSRLHFMVEVNPPLLRILDLDSRNGTYVNGERIKAQQLQDGDVIKAGHTTLRVALVGGSEPSMPAAAPAEPMYTPTPLPGPLPLPEQRPLPPGPVPLAAVAAAAEAEEDVALLEPLAAEEAPPAVSPSPAPVPPPVALPQLPAPPRAAPPPPYQPPAMPLAATPLPAPAAVPPPLPLLCPACSKPRASAADLVCADCRQESEAHEQFLPAYLLVRRLGKGGMGVVWLGVQRGTGVALAIKTILPAVSADSNGMRRFLREAEVLRQLDHPNIVAFRDLGEAAGQLYFAMDYVRGVDLHKVMVQRGPLPVAAAVRIVCQVLQALAHAHAPPRCFVHRDIKPANILLAEGPGGRRLVKVADFGLARVYQASQLSGLTMGGEVGGTPAFLPPEQITHFREVSPAADQYSTSAMLYHLLTGAYIHDFPQGALAGLVKILEEDPVPLRKRRPELPQVLADVIHRALARTPAGRYANVDEFRQALLPFAAAS